MTAGATPHGTLGEEAARLIEALSHWAGEAFDDEHIATGAPECRLCPVCLLIGGLRSTRPETVEHLLDAAGSLVAALRSATAGHERHWAQRRSGPVQHVDVE